MSNPTCDDRIEGHLRSRIEDLAHMHAVINQDGGVIDGEDVTSDDALDRIAEYALGIETHTTMVVLLSTGGPGDQLEVEIERGTYGWELAETSAAYRFSDWFDGATIRTADRDVMEYLENMVQYLT